MSVWSSWKYAWFGFLKNILLISNVGSHSYYKRISQYCGTWHTCCPVWALFGQISLVVRALYFLGICAPCERLPNKRQKICKVCRRVGKMSFFLNTLLKLSMLLNCFWQMKNSLLLLFHGRDLFQKWYFRIKSLSFLTATWLLYNANSYNDRDGNLSAIPSI